MKVFVVLYFFRFFGHRNEEERVMYTVSLSKVNTPEATSFLYYPIAAIVKDIIIPVASARDPQRTGGWFTFWRRSDQDGIWAPVVGFSVGSVSADRFLKYDFFATEKAFRLSYLRGHISSWQSRDDSNPDRMKHNYGGAIKCGDFIFSFSGFTEHEDEMVGTLGARRLQLIGERETSEIIAASGNEPLRLALRNF